MTQLYSSPTLTLTSTDFDPEDGLVDYFYLRYADGSRFDLPAGYWPSPALGTRLVAEEFTSDLEFERALLEDVRAFLQREVARAKDALALLDAAGLRAVPG